VETATPPVSADQPAATTNGTRGERARGWLSAFWHRAYVENITGMAAMVAYNLALALFPFALLVLFIFGQVVGTGDLQDTVIDDLQGIFPAVEGDAVESAVDRIRSSSTTIGVAAAIGAIWIGASFWGAMDTAFCRIYHVECRSWMAQKRFALVMLLVVTLFLAASAVVPLAERLATSSADDLPFGLDRVQGIRSVAVLAAALTITFGIMSLIYYVVPKGHVPWHGVWPGALFVTVTTAIGNAVFPVYLTSISDLDRIGGALGFILIALIWFYLISLAILAGAVINALRHEWHDTGRLDIPGWKPGTGQAGEGAGR
jgi:membrane protein